MQSDRALLEVPLCVQFGAVATACGIGGGPFFVPLFTYDLGFSKFPPRPVSMKRSLLQMLTVCPLYLNTIVVYLHSGMAEWIPTERKHCSCGVRSCTVQCAIAAAAFIRPAAPDPRGQLS